MQPSKRCTGSSSRLLVYTPSRYCFPLPESCIGEPHKRNPSSFVAADSSQLTPLVSAKAPASSLQLLGRTSVSTIAFQLVHAARSGKSPHRSAGLHTQIHASPAFDTAKEGDAIRGFPTQWQTLHLNPPSRHLRPLQALKQGQALRGLAVRAKHPRGSRWQQRVSNAGTRKSR